MTPRERASKLAKDMVRAYEVCATMKDLDGCVHAWTVQAEQAINAAVEEKDTRIAELEAALAVFEDGANWEVYPGLREPTQYVWRHDSDPRVLAQDAYNNGGTK